MKKTAPTAKRAAPAAHFKKKAVAAAVRQKRGRTCYNVAEELEDIDEDAADELDPNEKKQKLDDVKVNGGDEKAAAVLQEPSPAATRRSPRLTPAAAAAATAASTTANDTKTSSGFSFGDFGAAGPAAVAASTTANDTKASSVHLWCG
jgi:hypothetical protein